MRVQGSVGPGDLARCRGHPPSGAHHLPGRDDVRRAQRQRLDDVHLQLERGVGLAAVERRVHGTAHGRVEQRAEDAAVHRPDGVVQVLPDVETEDDLALFDADDAHPEERGDRRRRGSSLGDRAQVLQPAQVAGQRRADEGIGPGDGAVPDGPGLLQAEFFHGTQPNAPGIFRPGGGEGRLGAWAGCWWDATPSAPSSAVPWPRLRDAGRRSSWSPARAARGRRRSSSMSSRAPARRCCPAGPPNGPAPPTTSSPVRSGRRSGTRPGRCRRYSPRFFPNGASHQPLRTWLPWRRGCAPCWPAWPAAGRSRCSLTTCSGPTRPRSACCPRWPTPRATSRSRWSAVTAATSFRATTASAPSAPSCAGAASSPRSTSVRSATRTWS